MRQIAELARIKAQTDKTVANDCTEAEAMSAAEMLGHPLERYALSVTRSRCATRIPTLCR
jgi:hypothetical protein